MRRNTLSTWILALCIAVLAVYNLTLEVQVRMVQQETAAIEAEQHAPETPPRDVVVDLLEEPAV